MYALDPKTARKADQTGNRITEIGKYVGTFTQAEDITASTGTKGVALRFDSQGQQANLSLYTKKKDGTELMGLQALMAIMTCMRLRNIKPVAGTVKHWDNDAKTEVTKQAQVFPDLCNKPIGLLLETEDYAKNDGGVGTRMVIAGIFQADTELTASEVLDQKTKGEQLPKLVERLRHRPAKAAKAHSAHGAAAAGRPAGGGSGFDDMDDDIPF
jgi:hypothetical protein